MENVDILKILSRDSIDVDAVLESLHDTAVRNFQTLYEVQKSICGVFRYDVPLSDFKPVYRLPYQKESFRYPSRYGYSITKDMLYPDKQYLFKSHNLHKMPLSQTDISKYFDIFRYNFIIFIAGYFIPTGEIFISDDEVLFMIDEALSDNDESLYGISPTKMNVFREDNETVTILIVPNYETTSAALNRPTLTMYGGTVSSKKFSNYSILNTNSIYLMNTTDDYSLYAMVLAMYDDSKITIPSGTPTPSTHIRVQGVTLDCIYQIISVDSKNNWFMVSPSDYPMPLPPESILPFIIQDDGTLLFDSNISIKVYYPNIYEVVNIPDRASVRLYTLYRQDKNVSKYRNELEMLYLAGKDLVEMYKTKSLPDLVTDYKPVDFRWFQTDDFVQSANFPNKAIYNINLLKECVSKDVHVLIKYLYLRMREKHKYYINVSKLDLVSRIRNDTYSEDQLINSAIIFNEPRYIISMRKSLLGGDHFEFRMFIDTKFISPTHYTIMETYDFYHFYIPTKEITQTSIIELEKYRVFGFSEKIKPVKLGDMFPIIIPPNVKYVPVYNIQLYIEWTGRYIDKSKYKVIVHNDLLNTDIELDPDGHHMITNQFTIQIIDKTLLTLDLIVSVNHNPIGKLVMSDNTLKQTVPFENCSNLAHENIRVFHNGLRMLENTYDIGVTGKHGADVSIAVGFPVYKRDLCFIDSLPDNQICEFSLDIIDNEYGFVDTGDSLSLPFDLKWYDIYLNGMKLNKLNLDIITATRFFIKNVNSRRNLRIYKRNTVHEEFTMLHREIIEDRLFDNIDDIYNGLIHDRELVGDDMDDIGAELLPDYILQHYLFINNFLEYSFIDANKKQVTTEIEQVFPDLLDEHKILWLDSNTHQDAEVITFINSNVRSDEMRNGQYRYGWTPLHIGAHGDAKNGEYMCDPLTGSPGMKMQDGSIIASESLYRLDAHKQNFYNLLLTIGAGNLTMYQLNINDNPVAKDVKFNTNILDSELVIEEPVERVHISFDMDVLERGSNDVLMTSANQPFLMIDVDIDGVSETLQLSLQELPYTNCISKIGSKLTIRSMMLVPNTTNVKVINILHSILIAF